MIFEQEHIIFEILDVLYLDQSYAKNTNLDRHFDALSFRIKSDTVIEVGNNQYELFDNSICYFPSGLPYTRISKNDRVIVIHFKAFNYHSNTLECFIPDNPEKYKKLFYEALTLWNNKGISYKHECSAILNKIFSEFLKDNKILCTNPKISDAVYYINKNYLNSDFSLSLAHEKAFMSEQYFRKLFKKEFGVSPKKYVIDKRIKHAEALLLTNYYTIKEISELCGFTDYNYFSTEFKKVAGISPSKYYYNYIKK